jgi:hypothetical protein
MLSRPQDDGIRGDEARTPRAFLTSDEEGRNMKTRNKFQALETAIVILVGAPAVALALAIWLNLSASPLTDYYATGAVVHPPHATGLIRR